MYDLYDRSTTRALLVLARLARHGLKRLALRSMRAELLLLAAGVDVDRLRVEKQRVAVS